MNQNELHGPKGAYRKSVEAFQTLSTQEATESSVGYLSNIIEDSGFGEEVTEQIHFASEILELIRSQNPTYSKAIDGAISSLHHLHKEVRKMSQKYVSDLHDIYSDVMLDIRHFERTSEEPAEGPVNESIEKLKSQFKRHL